jgi:hypothetical protein
LVYDPSDKPQVFDQVLTAIDLAYTACDALLDRESLRARRYEFKSLACDREYEPIHYENGIAILDKFAEYDSERGTLQVLTGWEVADEAQSQQYNVSIQIITPDWQNVGQADDRHLYDNILKWYSVEISTLGLPPGDYRAVVILYDRYNNAKVSGTDLSSGETGAILPISYFSITDSNSNGSK